MKTTATAVGVLAIALLAVPSLTAEGPVALRPTWKAGKHYTQTQTMDMKMTVPGAGLQKVQMEMEMSIDVEAEGEDKVVTTVVDAVSMKAGEMSYDSREEGAGGPLAAAMGPMIGQEIVVLYDSKDDFKSVRKLPEMKGVPAEANPFGDEESVKNLMGEAMRASFPEEPKSPGDKWESEIEMPMAKMGSIGIGMAFEFLGMEEVEGVEMAKIKFAGTFSGEMKNEATPGMVMKIGEGSKMDGHMYFDPVAGVMALMEGTTNMTMEVAGQKLSMEQEMVQRVRVEDK